MKLNPGASWTLRLELEIEPLPPPAAVAGSGVERFGGNFAFVGRPAWVKQRYLLFLVYHVRVPDKGSLQYRGRPEGMAESSPGR
jgi:hypothetical protein